MADISAYDAKTPWSRLLARARLKTGLAPANLRDLIDDGRP